MSSKTVIISCFHLLISRNIIATSIITDLIGYGARVVILIPAYKRDYFARRFGNTGAVIEGIEANQPSRTRRGLLFKRLAHLMLVTDSIWWLERFKISQGKPLFYRLLFYAGRILGRVPGAYRVVRRCDYYCSPYRFLDDVFDRYQPDLVFTTDVLNENDVALLQQARRRRIRSVGMVRSWDNLTVLGLMRCLPDDLLVWSDGLRQQAMQLNHMPREHITVVGIPHYDRYMAQPKLAREAFFAKIKADPAKPLIFFAPVGDLYIRHNDVDRLIVDILASMDVNTMVRFPPADTVSGLEDFRPPARMFYDRPGVAYDPHRVGDRDLSPEDDDMLVNGIYHADLVVTGPSTIAIEAALFDKPMILPDFYRATKVPLERIIPYHYVHYRAIIESGGAPLAQSPEEFRDLIRQYLHDPSLHRLGRARIIREQYGGVPDGQASSRVAKALIMALEAA